MPGLAGTLAIHFDIPNTGLEPMLGALSYGRATTVDCYEEGFIGLGCVHSGTGGQRNIYQSDELVVVFFGYLTEPAIPPGTTRAHSYQNEGQIDAAPAAHYIHDAYMEWGDAILRQLAGAFAFAIWDKREQTLLLVSDHLGLRPIYYAEHNGIFRFASEVKGLLVDPNFPRRPDMAAWADFFQFGYILENKTCFEDIQLLPPASVLKFQQGRWSISSYWEISFPDPYPRRSEKGYDDMIYQAIQSSVKKMVRPNIRYGLSLSGGLDSRWIAAFLSQYEPATLTFTLGEPASDDTILAKQVASRLNLSQLCWEPVNPYTSELSEAYSYLVDSMDNLTSTDEFSVTMRIGDYVDVAAGGFLAGPIFGYDINPWSALIRKQDVERYYHWRYQGDSLTRDVWAQVFDQQKGPELKALANDALHRCLNAAPCERGFQVLQYFNIRHHQRRCINAAQLAKLPFVDIYHPLADDDVVNAALQVPVSQLMVEHAYGHAMATHFPELGAIPWTFTLAPLSISRPAAVLKKMAQLSLGKWLAGTPPGNHPLIRARKYYTNHLVWMRGPGRKFIEETLLSPEANATGLFNPDGLRRIVTDYLEGRREVTSFIGEALTLALWSRQFLLPSTPTRPAFFNNISTFSKKA